MTKNRECPKCREAGRDKYGDHLFLMEDGETWCCNKTEIHPLYLERPEGGEVKIRGSNVREIAGYPIVKDKSRGISQWVAEFYRVRTEFNESNGEPRAKYYPETSKGEFLGYKGRTLPKKFFSVHLDSAKGKVPDFFGQAQCTKSGKKLLICAGEEDTQAAKEILYQYSPDYTTAVVGVPRGEDTSEATFQENLEFIQGFDEVIVCMDNDEPGRKALARVAPLIGERLRVLQFIEKDISDMLVKGRNKEFLSTYFNPKEYKPVNIVSPLDIIEQAILPVEWGYSYPWDKLTKLTYGLKHQQGEIIAIGGGPGLGKSTLTRQILRHLMFYHNQPVANFDIEEGAVTGLKKMIGGVMGLPIHLPDCDYDQEEARRIGQTFEGKAFFYDGDCESWDEVESGIRYFASKGVRYFYIDPLSALVEHLSASEGNQELGRIMRSMRKMRKHQGLTFFHVNHLNNPQGSKDHGEGAKVKGSQFSGSRAQWKYSTLMMGLEGNLLADDSKERDMRTLRVIKDRLGGNAGTVQLFYNRSTGVLEQKTPEEY